ncbi:MAG: CO dehydrogenase/acetyl-CoA synthase complex subunit epsilon [Methermicoccaceae archaeon]
MSGQTEKSAKKKLDTTRHAYPYDRADYVGPTSAKAVLPKVIAKTISRLQRPLLVVGSRITDGELKKLVELSEIGDIPIAATGGASKLLADVKSSYYINLHVLSSYLMEGTWKGFDRKGMYDGLIFAGHTYYHLSPILRGIKNFASVKLLSIDRYYYPAAELTFGNLSNEEYAGALSEVVNTLRDELKKQKAKKDNS